MTKDRLINNDMIACLLLLEARGADDTLVDGIRVALLDDGFTDDDIKVAKDILREKANLIHNMLSQTKILKVNKPHVSYSR